jgi:hypothetical protein
MKLLGGIALQLAALSISEIPFTASRDSTLYEIVDRSTARLSRWG